MSESGMRADPAEGLPSLSLRELEVLDMARLGLTNAQIATRLGLTAHTVKYHLASVYRKLGAVNRTDALVRWISGQVVTDHEAAR